MKIVRPNVIQYFPGKARGSCDNGTFYCAKIKCAWFIIPAVLYMFDRKHFSTSKKKSEVVERKVPHKLNYTHIWN